MIAAQRAVRKIAILGDIHGNWVAMRQVAADLVHQHADTIVGLGDYLDTSRAAARVVEWMQDQPHAYFVRGDNDCWEDYERFHPQEQEASCALYHHVTRF
jgi:predicted phosphodiesterase